MVELRPEGPCELGTGCLVENSFEGTSVEDDGTWEGM